MASLAVVALVLIAVPWAFKLAFTPELGDRCGGSFDCAALDGRCVGAEGERYCTRVCESEADCPEGAHCGVPVDDEWQLWFAQSPMSERMCVPGPKPAHPPKPGQRPGAKLGEAPAPVQVGGGAVSKQRPDEP